MSESFVVVFLREDHYIQNIPITSRERAIFFTAQSFPTTDGTPPISQSISESVSRVLSMADGHETAIPLGRTSLSSSCGLPEQRT